MRRLAHWHGGLRLNAGALVMSLWLVSALALAGCSTTASAHPASIPSPIPSFTMPPTPTPGIGPLTCIGAFEESNPIAAENTCRGTTAWRQNLPLGTDHAIEGYVSSASVAAGQSVRLYVSTTAASYTYAIYRMGYYQGLGARLMYQSSPVVGIQQPAPLIDPTTYTVECIWRDPVTIATRRSWVSGVYLIKLISSDGNMRYTFFVLRNATVHTPILYVLPFLTYQAYNLWGGYSLYRGTQPDGVTLQASLRSFAVSFDRPYMKNGLSTFGLFDLPLLSWVESQSYNMSYAADFNLDAMTGSMSQYRLIIVSGHSEYWSSGMRTNVTRARDAGVSLAFFGANDVYWHVRLQASRLGVDREVVCYKHGYYHDAPRNSTDPLAASDPSAATVLWGDPPLNQPERLLLGEPYHGAVVESAPLTLSSGSAPYLGGSSLTPGASLNGLVGAEYDRVDPKVAPAGLQIIAASTVHCVHAGSCPASGIDISNATIYTAPSGAKVFDAGTFQWSWALSYISATGYVQATTSVVQVVPTNYVDPGFQQLTANIMNSMLD